MTTIKYVVKRAFTYGGKRLEPGDEWHPSGGRLDETIKRELYYVRIEEVEEKHGKDKK